MPPSSEITFLVQEDPDGGLVASALDHSIVTQADDLPKLRDAVQCQFEYAQRPGFDHFV